MKWVLYVILALVMISMGLACKDTYDIDERIIIIDSIESTGENATCTINIFSSNQTEVSAAIMTQRGLVYTYNGSSLSPGVYTSDISCEKNSSLYQSECKFNVEGTKMITLIALTLGFAIILLILGLWKQDVTLGSIAGLIFMAVGVFILANGVDGIDNLVTLGVGILSIAGGFYVFMMGNIDVIESFGTREG